MDEIEMGGDGECQGAGWEQMDCAFGEWRVGRDSSAMASGGDMMGLEDGGSAAQPGTGAMEANGDGRGDEAEGEDLETNVERGKASWMDTVYS